MTNSHTITILIGIDDTDNLESRGTGYHARSLGSAVAENGWGICNVITRHQLLLSPLVPYTSHNSAACVRVSTQPEQIDEIEAFCIDYLLTESAEGSDVGLCIAQEDKIPASVHQFGFVCKRRLVTQHNARELASNSNIKLHGLTGNHDGIIGALAATGLSASGCDGRMLWLKGMRERADQTVRLSDLLSQTGIDVVQNIEGKVLEQSDSLIEMGAWPRAIWLGGQATLIVEPHPENNHVWQVAAKDYLRQF